MKTKYTDEQLTEFLTQSMEQDFQRFNEEYSQEVLAHFRAEQSKNETEKIKKQAEPVVS
jgi:hypothetical protein